VRLLPVRRRQLGQQLEIDEKGLPQLATTAIDQAHLQQQTGLRVGDQQVGETELVARPGDREIGRAIRQPAAADGLEIVVLGQTLQALRQQAGKHRCHQRLVACRFAIGQGHAAHATGAPQLPVPTLKTVHAIVATVGARPV
jgi:hypothetical protein